jgi:hypothetical protein
VVLEHVRRAGRVSAEPGGEGEVGVVIARSGSDEAIHSLRLKLDCFASLAMTANPPPAASDRARPIVRSRPARRRAQFRYSNIKQPRHSRTNRNAPRRERARVMPESSPPERGRGECRVASAPAASRGKNKNHTSLSHHGRAGITRHSRTRMVLTVSFALSLVTGLFCHHRRADHLRET